MRVSLWVKLPFWASPLSSVKMGIMIPTSQCCAKELSKGSEQCGRLIDISFLFFFLLPCSFVSSLSSLGQKISPFLSDTSTMLQLAYICVYFMRHPQMVEKKRGPMKWKHLRILSVFKFYWILLTYHVFQASSSPAVGLEAHSTDTRTWSSTISFYVLVTSHPSILDCLLCTPQLLAQRERQGQGSNKTLCQTLYVEGQIEFLKQPRKVGPNASFNNAEG